MSSREQAEIMTAALTEQVEDIGDMLVEAKIVTRDGIGRDGVRFALRNALEERGLLPARRMAARRMAEARR